jgi:hypothetical protein
LTRNDPEADLERAVCESIVLGSAKELSKDSVEVLLKLIRAGEATSTAEALQKAFAEDRAKERGSGRPPPRR